MTRQDRKAAKAVPNHKWRGHITEIPTDEDKLYLSSVLDLLRAAFAACPMSDHPDAELTGDAIKMVATVRGGRTRSTA